MSDVPPISAVNYDNDILRLCRTVLADYLESLAQVLLCVYHNVTKHIVKKVIK